MATLSFTIPDKALATVLDAFCSKNGYLPVVLDANGKPVVNPESQQQFLKRKVIEFVTAGAADAAYSAAGKIAADKARSDIGVTQVG